MEVVALLAQGRTVAAQCGLFTHKSVPVIFEQTCILRCTVQGMWKCLVLYLAMQASKSFQIHLLSLHLTFWHRNYFF